MDTIKAGYSDRWFFMAIACGKLVLEKHEGNAWEKRSYKIADANESGLCYQIQKTQVKSSGGSDGLMGYLEREVSNSALYIFANKVWDTTKELK